MEIGKLRRKIKHYFNEAKTKTPPQLRKLLLYLGVKDNNTPSCPQNTIKTSKHDHTLHQDTPTLKYSSLLHESSPWQSHNTPRW